MSFSAKKHNVQYIVNLRRYSSRLKMSTIVPVFKCDDKTDPDPKYLDCQTFNSIYIRKAYVWENDELHKGIQSTLLYFSKYGDRTGNQPHMPY